MRKLIVLSACAGLAACSGGIQDVTSRNLELVALSSTGEEIVAPPLSFSRSVLRSYIPDAEGDWQEAPGARCSVEVGPYSAVVTTPVRISAPDMRPVAMPLVATCTMGDYAGRAEFPSKPGFDGPYGSLSVGMMQAGGTQ